MLFSGTLCYYFIKDVKIYIPLVEKKASPTHIFRIKFALYFFSIVLMTGSFYSNLLLPIYYLQYLRNENSDRESPIGSNAVPPLSAFFNECNFLTLPMIAWAIYRTVKNKHVQKLKKKPRGNRRRRANSHESRHTFATDFVAGANEELLPATEKRRCDSFDKTRESTIRPTTGVATLFDDPAEEDQSESSLENLNEKIEKFKRDES